MNRFLFLSIAVLVFSCQTTEEHEIESPNPSTEIATEMKQAGFIHTVFFWLKEGTSDAQKAAFEKGLEKLGTTPSIQSFYYGKPAGTPREVVDNSYDYAWVVHFANAADQDAYQVDPIHYAFIEDHQDIWEKVQVYDTLLK
ncbi:MAG: Dabb family protein [Bacteroidota bacterium]